MPPELYPVFLKLAGLPVVVVGGGPIAASKLAGLVAAGARITVVAPAICDEVRRQDVTLVERGFTAADLDGARWVVAAAPPEINREVAAAAAERGLFINAVDDMSSASAYLGGVVRRGSLLLAISTNGLAPALAGLLREALEAVLPDDLERWIDIAKAARADWKRDSVPMAERRPLLLRALDRVYALRAAAGAPPATATSAAAAAAVAPPATTTSAPAAASATTAGAPPATATSAAAAVAVTTAVAPPATTTSAAAVASATTAVAAATTTGGARSATTTSAAFAPTAGSPS